MSLDNLISVALTEDEKTSIMAALVQLEDVLKGKMVNLTPEQKQSYGRIGNKTENWIEKVKLWMNQRPETVPYYLDLVEFQRDNEIRNLLKPFIARMNWMTEGLSDTSVLLSQDIYNFALAYYRNIKLISKANVPGASEIYADLSSQFPGRPSAVPEETNPKPEL